MKEVTLVITSCGRFDLLEETLDSFFEYNTYPIKKIIITEDSTEGKKLKKLISKYDNRNQNFRLIVNETRLGQLKSIDKAYREIDTEYIFHCEDDWKFLKRGFIEKSMEVMEEDEKILVVGLRSKDNFKEDFFYDEDYVSKKGEHYYSVKGEIFTYNPALRRKKDMDLFGSHEKLENQRYEEVLSDFYKEHGFKAIFFKEPYVTHIGNKRHVHFSNRRKNTVLNFKIDRLIKKIRAKILKLREGNAVQIFGEDIKKIKESAKYIENLGVKHINLNCGCPMKKIVNCGYGAALVKEPEKIKKILSEIKSTLNDDTKLSVKIRIGYKEPENYVQIGKIAEEIGCDHITIHGRTREQLYSGKADWKYIKEVKDNISIPVIGNGDIFTGEDALEKISYSNVDGVMLARGIFGNPWLIRDIREILEYGEIKTPTTKEDKINMAIEHLKRIRVDNDNQFIFDVRKHISWYLKGMENCAEAKRKINTISDYDEIIKILEEML